MKRIISIITLICSMFVFCGITGCAASETTQASDNTEILLQIGNPMMTVNGVQKSIDEDGTVPVIVNERTLLPVRAVVESMDGSVEWNNEAQEVTLNYGSDEIKLVIDSLTAQLNGEEQTLDTAPTIINDRTMLPIRFIAESFNFNVDWEENTQTVTITKNTEVAPTTEPTVAPTETPNEDTNNSKALLVYFSATGTTKSLAEKISSVSGLDAVELVPENPYTSDNLNYNNDDCRANQEQHDDTARPKISNSIDNFENYDTIILGYPIWWGTMPKLINTFIESYDFTGKTIMPFCTSGGSSIDTSVSAIKSECPNATVTDGFRGTGSTADSQIEEWLTNNGFNK